MPSMADHESFSIVKMLVAADSGSGKSGALASLIDAGLKVRVLDADNGLSVVKGYVKDKEKLRTNMHFVKLVDDLSLVASRVGVKKAHAFQEAMDALDGGEKGKKLWGEDFGAVTTWGPDVVLVVDSLSMLGRASLQMVLQLNGKGHAQPEIQHYGTAMENIERLIGILTSPAVGCHVIFNTHLTNVDGTAKLYPEALGSKLSPKIGRYFDTMVTLSVTPGTLERKFKTSKDGLFACKTSTKLAEEYPIASGLADMFKAITGKSQLV